RHQAERSAAHAAVPKSDCVGMCLATARAVIASDVCAVPAAGIVAEAMVALVLADAVAEKFGGDSTTETRRNVTGFLDHLEIA
ncbi:hypothetical protein ABZX29_01755, partial [Streptomyces zhihengii]